ncbi:lipopolysaccharide biosynthesis protein, partial [Pseudomonadota bacterium]
MNTEKYSELFDNDKITSTLKRKSVKGAAITGVSRTLRLLIGLCGTAVLARILTPDDYGLVVMAAILTNYVRLFADIGLAAATVQRENINHQQVSTLFWIDVGIGFLLALLVCAISPLIASFFNEPALKQIAIAMSVTFFMTGFVLQPRALLRRHMRFFTVEAVIIIAQICGVLGAIVLAMFGWGYWALVMQAIIIAFIELVGIWIIIPWFPSRPRWVEGVGSMVRFGGDILIFNTINYFSRNADNILIGKFWGAAPLALYDKAYSLLMMPVIQINGPV